jgi:hypothetical protein
MGMPPMHEPKLIELGKLRFGAAGVAASIVILLPREIRPLPNAKLHKPQNPISKLCESCRAISRNDEKIHKAVIRKQQCKKGKNL